MYETLSLNPGLILLRYKKQGGQANAVIRPVIPPESLGSITLLFDPSVQNDALTTPGEVCVLRCDRPALLGLEITSRQPWAPPRGSIEVEYIAQPKRQAQAIAARTAPSPSPEKNKDYIAHFHLLGDQPGVFGEWLKGDGVTQGIEGLSILATPGLPSIMLRDHLTGQVAAPGEFLGSRGRFRPLTDLEMWIDDPGGSFLLRMEALFRNAGLVEQSGSFLTIRGIDPDERLLGINLRILSRHSRSPSPSDTHVEPVRGLSPRTERVKIFRK